jgi:rRNA maturation endonuclease Nob1
VTSSSPESLVQAMVALMKKYEAEDHKTQMKRAEAIQRMKIEIMVANEKAIKARKEVKEKEKEVRSERPLSRFLCLTLYLTLAVQLMLWSDCAML